MEEETKKLTESQAVQTDLFDFAENETLIEQLRQELAEAKATITKLSQPYKKVTEVFDQPEARLNVLDEYQVTSAKEAADDFLLSLNQSIVPESSMMPKNLFQVDSVGASNEESPRPQHPQPVKPRHYSTRMSRPKTQALKKIPKDTKKHLELLPLPPISVPPPRERKRPRRELKKKTSSGLKRTGPLDDFVYSDSYSSQRKSFHRVSAYLTAKPTATKLLKSKKEWDWADSPLDSANPPSEGLSVLGIENYLKQINENALSIDHYSRLYNEVLSCFEGLKRQLGLNDAWMAVPPFSPDGVAVLLKACSRLVRSRALTVKILSLIHDREDAMLRLMTMAQDEQAIKAQFHKITKVSEHIEQTVVFWKHSGLPYTAFVYLGEDITTKIKDDMSRISSLYKHLSLPDLYSSSPLLAY